MFLKGIIENRENVLVTNNQDIVDLYVEEFEKIWEISDPKKSRILAETPPLPKNEQSRNVTKFRK